MIDQPWKHGLLRGVGCRQRISPAGGLALAAPVVLFAGPGLRLLLFDVKVYDARTLLGVGILMTASAIIAAYIPGRRASRIQPSVALHAD